jgi:polysaccharide biosynthesis transport protein
MGDAISAPPPRRGPPGAGPAAEPAFGGGRRIRPLASLLAHWKLALAASTVVACAGLPVAYQKGTAEYQASATIQVAPRFAGNLSDDKELELQSNTQYRDFVQQQVRSINRFDVVGAAITRLKADHVPWQKSDESLEHATARLQAALQVKPVAETYLIQVSYADSDKTDMAAIVNAVVDSFLITAKREVLVDGGAREGNLTRERDQVQQSLTALLQKQTRFVEQLNVTTFNENTRNPYDELLIAVRTQLAAARQRRIEAEAHAASYDGRQRPEAAAALSSAAQDLVARDNGLMALKSGLYQRRAALVAKRSQLAEGYPGRADIERELQEIDTSVNLAADQLRGAFATTIADARNTERFEAQRVEQGIAAEVLAYEGRSRAFAVVYQEAIDVGAEIGRLRKRREAIADRQDFLRLEAQAPGFFRLVSSARTPEQPSSGGRRKLALLVLAAALALGLALPPVVDFLDPRVHTADELEALIGFRPMGVIAEPSEAAGSGLARDAVQRLATRLVYDHRDHNTRVVVVTAVKAAPGSRILINGLADALEYLGLKVLVFESKTLISDPGDGPGTHLGQLASLDRLIAEARDCCDLVIVDAAPLLLSADTTLLVRAADLVLVTVRASTVTRAEVKATLKHLEALDPSAVGVAIVDVPYRDVLGHRSLQNGVVGDAPAAPGLIGRLWAHHP